MEKIIDYKLSDFLRIEDSDIIESHMFILTALEPLKEIDNPKYSRWNRQPKKLSVKTVRDLKFFEVTNLRTSIGTGNIEDIFDCIKMVTDLKEKHILKMRITQFYGVIASIREQLIEIGNIESAYLISENQDPNLVAVQAQERMSQFGQLNVINSLANDDILKWEKVEQLPYNSVFSKLLMDKIKNDISFEINERMKTKQK